MASKSDFDEELSNGGESSKGNNTSLIVNVNDTQSDLEEQESLNYSDHEENESENESSEKKESEKKSSKKDDSSSSKKKKSPSKDSKSNSKVDPAKTRYLWVSGIPIGTKTNQLEELFSDYGKVLAIKIIRGGNSTLLGFVKLETVEQAQKCMDKLNKTDFRGNKIELFKERPVDKDDQKLEKISFRDSRKFSSRPLPIRRPIPFRGSPRSHFRGSVKPIPRMPPRHSISSSHDYRRQEREESMRLEREKHKLKLEREKLERDRAELLKIERETRTFDHRDRFHDDKRGMRSIVKRPIEEPFIDDKRYDDFSRRDDYRGRFESTRTSPERKMSSGRNSYSISSRRFEDNSRNDRFTDNKFDSSKSWNMSDSWMSSGNDRWQSSSYEQPRIMSSTISTASLARIHSNSDMPQNVSSRGYFNNNNRRY